MSFTAVSRSILRFFEAFQGVSKRCRRFSVDLMGILNRFKAFHCASECYRSVSGGFERVKKTSQDLK